jgi:predicted NBD/HSP70 family sugar kinase
MSRSSVAAATGLNKTTVSSLVAELLEHRLLEETGDAERPGAVGRPSQKLRLSPHGVVSVGLEIDIDSLSVWASDLTGAVRHRRRIGVDNRDTAPERVLDSLAALATEALTEVGGQGLRAVGVSVAAHGLVDVNSGLVARAPDLGWRRTPVAAMLAERLGDPRYPIRVDNGANLAALAELWAGAGRRLRDFVYVSAEVGVGAGVISGGELLRGAAGFAGELGHVTVDPNGPRCTCGARGCLSMFAGRDVLLELAGLDESVPGRSPLAPDALAARLADGDARTADALRQVGTSLGIALAGAVNLLNPSAIVLGGYLGALAPWLEPPVREQLGSRVLAADCAPCEVLPSELGEEAGAQGAAALALHELIADPALVASLG